VSVSLGVKLPGREADHSPPSRTEVKNAWSYIVSVARCLIKHRENFNFRLYRLYSVYFVEASINAGTSILSRVGVIVDGVLIGDSIC
jgi:hypothetical protein